MDLGATIAGQKGPKMLEVSEGHQNEKFRSRREIPFGVVTPGRRNGRAARRKAGSVGDEARSARRGFTRIQSSAAERRCQIGLNT